MQTLQALFSILESFATRGNLCSQQLTCRLNERSYYAYLLEVVPNLRVYSRSHESNGSANMKYSGLGSGYWLD
jgi:hypothetical protein